MIDRWNNNKSPAPQKGGPGKADCVQAHFPRNQAETLVLSVHAALGDQQDSSQNQDGATDVQDGGAHAAGGAGPKGFPFGCAKPCPWAEAVCEADWP